MDLFSGVNPHLIFNNIQNLRMRRKQLKQSWSTSILIYESLNRIFSYSTVYFLNLGDVGSSCLNLDYPRMNHLIIVDINTINQEFFNCLWEGSYIDIYLLGLTSLNWKWLRVVFGEIGNHGMADVHLNCPRHICWKRQILCWKLTQINLHIQPTSRVNRNLPIPYKLALIRVFIP